MTWSVRSLSRNRNPIPSRSRLTTAEMPDVEPEAALPGWLVAPICGAGLLVGLGLGYGKKLKEKLVPAGK